MKWILVYAVSAAVPLALAAGCGDAPHYACPDPSRPCGGEGAADTSSGSGGPPACAGSCVPSPADGWSNPVLLWIGSPSAVPPCPSTAPHREYDGFADPEGDPLACSPCACAPPSGTCALPETWTAANTAACPATAGGVGTLGFDAAPAWDGTCTALNAIPSGAMCDGSPCVQSLTVAPLVLHESACAVLMAPAPTHTAHNPIREPLAWGTAGRACGVQSPGWCASADTVCAPEPAGSPDFATCIHQDGDVDCPADWPDKHVLFDDADDTRACGACACAPPEGGQCTGMASVYGDAACSVLLDSISVASSGEACVVVQPPGAPLGSKDVTMVTYEPGVCAASGGDATGSVNPTGPTTFCCHVAP